jgi:hypothetical protein
VIHSTILANLGTVAETGQEWAAAGHHHREALRLRREVADARGVLQSFCAPSFSRSREVSGLAVTRGSAFSTS